CGVGPAAAPPPRRGSAGLLAGFPPAGRWLPLAADYHAETVANPRRDPTSIYNLYRRLLRLRRETPPLTVGSYQPVVAGGDLLLDRPADEDQRRLVALKLRPAPSPQTRRT